jgi:hypothetical protein
MEKYFKVTVKLDMYSASVSAKVRKIEYVMAKSLAEVIDDYKTRHGKYLISLKVVGIEEHKLPKNKSIRIII